MQATCCSASQAAFTSTQISRQPRVRAAGQRPDSKLEPAENRDEPRKMEICMEHLDLDGINLQYIDVYWR